MSNVAMRSAGGTKSGEPFLVTLATKSLRDFFVLPSFHDGSVIGGLRDCRRGCQHAKQRSGDDVLLAYELHKILLILILPFIHRLGLMTSQFRRKE